VRVDFIGPCNLCPAIRRISLTIRDCLPGDMKFGYGPRRDDHERRSPCSRMIDLPPPAVPAV
jgi:hypothetical protein